MFRVGERVRWMEPLDNDYSYGTILKIENNIATVSGTGYYVGKELHIHLKHIRRVKLEEKRA